MQSFRVWILHKTCISIYYRKYFPDWAPEGVKYDKFRRHYLIAQKAYELLTNRQ